MPRFAKMLIEGMRKRGHEVENWQPQSKLVNLSKNNIIRKWLGYIDQYIIFPRQAKKQIKKLGENILYVFTDQALGPWVSLAYKKKHVVHCHDFLAQLSAIGEIKKNPTLLTGKLYQKFIRNGYSKAKNFISVSKKTEVDLHKFLNFQPEISEVVYNGLNQIFELVDKEKAKNILSNLTGLNLNNGYILHVGGNQWYKNKASVIGIYDEWCKIADIKIPLLLVGEKVSLDIEQLIARSSNKADIHVLNNLPDEHIRLAYCGATVFLFPSIAEGFGWPIAEAMASGCPVITTDAAPMTEVAGNAGFLIPPMPDNEDEIFFWYTEAAKKVNYVFNLSLTKRDEVINAGIANATRFDTEAAIDSIERIYLRILNNR